MSNRQKKEAIKNQEPATDSIQQYSSSDEDSVIPESRAMCSAHRKVRSIWSLIGDGAGGVRCKESEQCRVPGEPKAKEPLRPGRTEWACGLITELPMKGKKTSKYRGKGDPKPNEPPLARIAPRSTAGRELPETNLAGLWQGPGRDERTKMQIDGDTREALAASGMADVSKEGETGATELGTDVKPHKRTSSERKMAKAGPCFNWTKREDSSKAHTGTQNAEDPIREYPESESEASDNDCASMDSHVDPSTPRIKSKGDPMPVRNNVPFKSEVLNNRVLLAMIANLRKQYPMNDEMFETLTKAEPEVVRNLVRTFKPRVEKGRDYSAMVKSYLRDHGVSAYVSTDTQNTGPPKSSRRIEKAVKQKRKMMRDETRKRTRSDATASDATVGSEGATAEQDEEKGKEGSMPEQAARIFR